MPVWKILALESRAGRPNTAVNAENAADVRAMIEADPLATTVR